MKVRGVVGLMGCGFTLALPLLPTVRSALRMLEGRSSKEAQEFVKRLKELEKCMEADP